VVGAVSTQRAAGHPIAALFRRAAGRVPGAEREVVEAAGLWAKANGPRAENAAWRLLSLAIDDYAAQLWRAEPELRVAISARDLDRRILGWVATLTTGSPGPFTDDPPSLVWALDSDAAIEAMRAELGPRQVWIRVDPADRDHRDILWSLAKAEQRRFRTVASPGRPRSPRKATTAERAALRDYRPEMTPREVYRLLVKAGVHPDDGPFGDVARYQRNTRRVQRFRLRASLK
jgi:hypothetical protein